jgi:hypothetical protein
MQQECSLSYSRALQLAPPNYLQVVRGLAWIPAFAGMTI